VSRPYDSETARENNDSATLLLKTKFYGILISCTFCVPVCERKKMSASPATTTPHQDQLCVVAFKITQGLVIDAGNLRRDFNECYEQVVASLREQRMKESIAKA
jgi:hypothetical protein